MLKNKPLKSEISILNPFLVKHTMKEVNGEIYYAYSLYKINVSGGVTFFQPPKKDKEQKEYKKQITSTKKWIDVTDKFWKPESEFNDFSEVEFKVGTCDFCNKSQKTVETPFANSPPSASKKYRKLISCHSCLNKVITRLREDIDKKQESGESEKFVDWEEVLESLTNAEILENKFMIDDSKEKDVEKKLRQ